MKNSNATPYSLFFTLSVHRVKYFNETYHGHLPYLSYKAWKMEDQYKRIISIVWRIIWNRVQWWEGDECMHRCWANNAEWFLKSCAVESTFTGHVTASSKPHCSGYSTVIGFGWSIICNIYLNLAFSPPRIQINSTVLIQNNCHLRVIKAFQMLEVLKFNLKLKYNSPDLKWWIIYMESNWI